MALPFLWPVHRPPQAIFDSEWLAAVLLFALAGTVATQRGIVAAGRWPFVAFMFLLLGLAFVQLKVGLMHHDEQFYFAFVYVGVAISAYVAGRGVAAAGLTDQAMKWFAVALVVGALLSVVVQVLQLIDVTGLPWWLHLRIADPEFRTRPNGNVGQANVLVTYLCWAMVAVLLLSRTWQSRWTLPLSVLVFTILAFGAGLTRSRMGLLFLGAVVLALWVPTSLRPDSRAQRAFLTAAILAGLLVSGHVIAEFVRFRGDEVASTLGRLAEGSLRLRTVMWADALKVSASAPWLGVGFGDYGSAQYWVATFDPALRPTPYVHNIVLQIAAEMGWPMALALVVLAVWWGTRSLGRRMKDPAQAFIWVLMALIGVHSLLEWPLWSMIFLIPACVLFALGEPDVRGPVVRLPVRGLLMVTLCGAVLAIPTFHEYDELSDNWTRALVARSAGKPVDDETLGKVLALAQSSRVRPFAERLISFLQLPHSIDPVPEEIAMLERALWQGADARIITRLVVVNARAGRLEESARHVERFLVFFPEEFGVLRAYILSSLDNLGPEADLLRRRIREAELPEIPRADAARRPKLDLEPLK